MTRETLAALACALGCVAEIYVLLLMLPGVE